MKKKGKTIGTTNEKMPELKKMDKYGLWVFIIGVLLMLGLPWILTMSFCVSILGTTETSNIGSSISGMTAPAIGLLSAGLVFLSFRAQIIMNARQIKQFEEQNKFNEKLLATNELQQQQIKDQQERLERAEKEKEKECALKDLNKVDEVITMQAEMILKSADKLLNSTFVRSFNNYRKTGIVPQGGMIIEFQKIQKAFMLNVTPIEKLKTMIDSLKLSDNDLFLIYFSKSDTWVNFVIKFKEVKIFYDEFVKLDLPIKNIDKLSTKASENIERLIRIICFIQNLESPKSTEPPLA